MPEIDAVTVKLPNYLTHEDLIASGRTPEQAEHIMNERVFGVGYERHPETGKPIERGFGSEKQQTQQHLNALAKAAEQAARTNPNSAEVIAAAVAAGVKAGLAAAKGEDFEFKG